MSLRAESTVPSSDLVTTTGGGRADDPFDPAANPELFEGVTLRRVAAYLVDLAIIGAVMLVAVAAFWVLGVLSFGVLSPVLAVLLPFIPLAYHTLLIGGPQSATVGMHVLGIEVRRVEGDRPGYLQAGLQTTVFYVTVGLTSWLILLVALFNGRGRTLHDYLCGTLTLRAPRRIEAPSA